MTGSSRAPLLALVADGAPAPSDPHDLYRTVAESLDGEIVVVPIWMTRLYDGGPDRPGGSRRVDPKIWADIA